MLGEPDAADAGRSLRDALVALQRELDTQIATLTARRERVRALLVEDAGAALDRPTETPAVLAWARERLAEHGMAVPEAIWEQDRRIFVVLEGFQWPAPYSERMWQAAEVFARHPELARELMPLAERLAAVATLPEDAPELARLADEVAAEGALDRLVAGMSDHLRELVTDDLPSPPPPFDALLSEMMLGALTPAQRRLLRLAREAHARTTGQEKEKEGE